MRNSTISSLLEMSYSRLGNSALARIFKILVSDDPQLIELIIP